MNDNNNTGSNALITVCVMFSLSPNNSRDSRPDQTAHVVCRPIPR